MSRLRRLRDAGVSIWLDTLSRDLLESGAFATLVDDYAVTGATSNPTIFAKALASSDRYDEDLRAAGGDALERFLVVALDDVRWAAAILAPIHERSAGTDGFVSFECTPDIAGDADAVLAPESDLRGKVAIANAQRAYGRYLARFAGERWEALQAAGARPQNAVLTAAAAEGVDLEAITRELEHEGVRAFLESYEQVLSHIETTSGAPTWAPSGGAS